MAKKGEIKQDETMDKIRQKKEKLESKLVRVCGNASGSLTMKEADDHSPGTEVRETPSAPRDASHWLTFVCASIMGLHLVHQHKDGTYVVCKARIVPAVVLYLLSCTAAVGNVVYLFSRGYITHTLIIMIMPVIIGCMFMVATCVMEILNARKMVDYMEDISVAGLTVKHHRALYYLLWLLLFALVDTGATLFLLPVPKNCILDLLVPVILNSIVPSLLDHYMCGFIHTLQKSFKKLAGYVSEIRDWTLGEVQAVATTWLTLDRLLTKHNQVFSCVLYMRLLLFVAQMMSQLYGLMQLRGPGCLGMAAALVVPLAQVLLRSYLVSVFGDDLQLAHEDVLCGLREAMRTHVRLQCGHHGQDLAKRHQCGQNDTHGESRCDQEDKCGQDRCGQDECSQDRCGQDECGQEDRCGQALHDLTSRLEARPASITVWGLNRLGRSTWVQQASVVLAYLVILLQLRPHDKSQVIMTCSDLDPDLVATYNSSSA